MAINNKLNGVNPQIRKGVNSQQPPDIMMISGGNITSGVFSLYGIAK